MREHTVVRPGDIRQSMQAVALRNVAVVGEGPNALVHALCVRDSGIDVRLGLEPGDPAADTAAAEGLVVMTPLQACEESDLIVLVAPAHRQEQLYADAIDDNLVEGDTLVVADGFGVRFEGIEAPAGVDVGCVMFGIDAARARQEFVEGRGLPLLVGVHTDASGRAGEAVIGYAAAVGGMGAHVIRTSVADMVDADAMASALACGVIPRLVDAWTSALAEGGCDELTAALLLRARLDAAVTSMTSAGHPATVRSLSAWHQHLARVVGGDPTELLAGLRSGLVARAHDAERAVTARWSEEIEGPQETARAAVREMIPRHHGDPHTGRRWR